VDACESASSAANWAREEFGTTDFGDKRLTKRIVSMAANLAQFPAGKATEVFQSAAALEGAYRFVRNERVGARAILEASCAAMLRRCADEPFVYVAIDGSSLSLVDNPRTKNLGVIGAYNKGGRGLKVIAALGVSVEGVTMGLTSMPVWARQKKKKKVPTSRLGLKDSELRYWSQGIVETTERFAKNAAAPRAWFQLDREGDAVPLLQTLSRSEHYFTVRGSCNRRIKGEGKRARYVYDELACPRARKGTYMLEVSPNERRKARTARMTIYFAPVELLLRDKRSHHTIEELPVYAVHVLETSEVPRGEKPIEWLLYTNYPVQTPEDLALVVHGYAQRWRVEEFFRTWKTTGCDVESTQLHSTERVTIWATMLAAVSTRIERLKQLARTQPNLPATVEFTELEVEVLVFLKRKRRKKNEVVNDNPTIEQAVQWVAEIGGYTGKSSGGPPGSVTIRRGLERVTMAAEAAELMRSSGKM
jgi:hypothetical protein